MKWAIPAHLTVYVFALLLGVCGCQRGLTDENAADAASGSDREEIVASSADTTSTHSIVPESSAEASSAADAPSTGVDRPAANLKPVPAHIPMPEGAVLLMSTPLGSDKHFVQAQYPDATDAKELLARFESGLAEHGWTPNDEPEDGAAEGLVQFFERENGKLSVSAYSKPDKSGLFVQIQLESR